MIEAHVAGTRYNIHVDPADGLLYGGGPGVQLTWMDAKIGDWVVTPRTGKPVEINALWINALESMIQFSGALKLPSTRYEAWALLRKRVFAKILEIPPVTTATTSSILPGIGNDALFARIKFSPFRLPFTPLTPSQQKFIVIYATPNFSHQFGLRSLGPHESGYIAHYRGAPRERDAAYHQGTVWGWLLGPFALAHFRVYQDKAAALRLLEPLAQAISVYGLGSLAEVYDAETATYSRRLYRPSLDRRRTHSCLEASFLSHELVPSNYSSSPLLVKLYQHFFIVVRRH